MSDRPTISTLPAGGRYSVATLNTNFQALRDHFDNVLGINGTGGDNNTMSGNLNMGGNNITNAGSVLDASGNDLVDQVGYAEEWANKAEDSLVSTAAGGDGSTEYSALHYSTKSAADIVLTNADVVSTNADVVLTNADVVSTNADVVLTNADVVTTTSSVSTVAHKFTFSSSTSMADPGAGTIRLNNGAVGSVTAIAIDATSADTGSPDISNFIATWGSVSNGTARGLITIRKGGTPATYAIYNVTAAVTDNTGWLQITVTHNSSSGSWSNADTMFITFAKSGADGGGLANVVEDTTPQLGGFLDTNSKFISHAQGAAIASVAGDTNIWTNFDGNTVHITGTNAITDFGTPKSAGDSMWVIFDGAASVVDSATITVAGNTNYQAAANDLALVYALSTSTFLFMPFPNSGLSPVYDTDTAKTDVANTFSAAQSGSITALADGANISVDLSANNHFSVTLGGNRTLDNPSNIVAGTSGSIFITQDGAGSRTLAYGGYYDFAAGAAPTLTTTASKVDRIDYIARTATSLHCVFTGDLS